MHTYIRIYIHIYFFILMHLNLFMYNLPFLFLSRWWVHSQPPNSALSTTATAGTSRPSGWFRFLDLLKRFFLLRLCNRRLRCALLYIFYIYMNLYIYICMYKYIYIYRPRLGLPARRDGFVFWICWSDSFSCDSAIGAWGVPSYIYSTFIWIYIYIYVCMNIYIYRPRLGRPAR